MLEIGELPLSILAEKIDEDEYLYKLLVNGKTVSTAKVLGFGILEEIQTDERLKERLRKDDAQSYRKSCS